MRGLPPPRPSLLFSLFPPSSPASLHHTLSAPHFPHPTLPLPSLLPSLLSSPASHHPHSTPPLVLSTNLALTGHQAVAQLCGMFVGGFRGPPAGNQLVGFCPLQPSSSSRHQKSSKDVEFCGALPRVQLQMQRVYGSEMEVGAYAVYAILYRP